VDGEGVGEGDVLGRVLGREHGAAAPIEVLDGEAAIEAAGGDAPPVAVADPQPRVLRSWRSL